MLLAGGKPELSTTSILIASVRSSSILPSCSFVNDDLSAFGSSTVMERLRHHSGASARYTTVDDVTSQLPNLYFV